MLPAKPATVYHALLQYDKDQKTSGATQLFDEYKAYTRFNLADPKKIAGNPVFMLLALTPDDAKLNKAKLIGAIGGDFVGHKLGNAGKAVANAFIDFGNFFVSKEKETQPIAKKSFILIDSLKANTPEKFGALIDAYFSYMGTIKHIKITRENYEAYDFMVRFLKLFTLEKDPNPPHHSMAYFEAITTIESNAMIVIDFQKFVDMGITKIKEYFFNSIEIDLKLITVAWTAAKAKHEAADHKTANSAAAKMGIVASATAGTTNATKNEDIIEKLVAYTTDQLVSFFTKDALAKDQVKLLEIQKKCMSLPISKIPEVENYKAKLLGALNQTLQKVTDAIDELTVKESHLNAKAPQPAAIKGSATPPMQSDASKVKPHGIAHPKPQRQNAVYAARPAYASRSFDASEGGGTTFQIGFTPPSDNDSPPNATANAAPNSAPNSARGAAKAVASVKSHLLVVPTVLTGSATPPSGAAQASPPNSARGNAVSSDVKGSGRPIVLSTPNAAPVTIAPIASANGGAAQHYGVHGPALFAAPNPNAPPMYDPLLHVVDTATKTDVLCGRATKEGAPIARDYGSRTRAETLAGSSITQTVNGPSVKTAKQAL